MAALFACKFIHGIYLVCLDIHIFILIIVIKVRLQKLLKIIYDNDTVRKCRECGRL